MHDRLFRALLRLLPQDLRAGYARDMQVTFRTEHRDAERSGRPAAVIGLWLRTIGDVARAAPAMHWDVLVRDVRYALRTMRRHPLHSKAAIVALALGIGANVAMYAVVHAVLLAPLPYGDPDRVVLVEERSDAGEAGSLGYPTFVDLRARSRSFTAMAGATQSFATLSGEGRDPARVDAMRVSASYFDVVGVRPAVGRAFRETEDRPGAARTVVILSHELWQRRFNGDLAILGRQVPINGIPFTVVGVMPETFDDLIAERLYGAAELWVPLGYDPAAAYACRTCRHIRVFGRLRTGVDTIAAKNELSAVLATLEAKHPTQYHRASAQVTRVRDLFLGPVRPVLLTLWAGVGVLLLAACANVANLLLLRATERTHEVAVRGALGVSRAGLARQLLTESLVLAALGGLVGLLPARLAIDLAAAAGPSQFPRLADASLDLRALLAACALSAASGITFGLVPLRQLARGDLAVVLRGAGRRTDPAGAWRTRATLAAMNVAMAAVLLVGAGLLVRSMSRLLSVTPGFDPIGITTAEVVVSGRAYKADRPADEIAVVTGFYDRVLSRLRGMPGVSNASAASTLPLGGGVDQFGFHVAGRLHANPEQAPSAQRFVVQTDFFETMKIGLLRGRVLDDRDTQTAPLVAVINETAARRLFSGEDPLGRAVMLGPPTAAPRTIVGVVRDLRHAGLDADPGFQVFVPHSQWAWAETVMTLVVRASADPGSVASLIRTAVREADPSQPVSDIRRYEAIVGESFGSRQFALWLLVAFSATAGVLAVVGLYGALGVVVGLRTREIGVRLALGARSAEVRRMLLAQGMRPAVLGVVAGLTIAALAATSLRPLLFGVGVHDPLTFGSVAAALMVATLGACLIPAWRAGRIDPGTVLRSE